MQKLLLPAMLMDYQNTENANAGGYLCVCVCVCVCVYVCTFIPDNYLSQKTTAIKNSFIM